MSSKEIVFVGEFEVYFVKNSRAKNILLKQNTKGEIILTCPRFCSQRRALRFAETQLAWIKAHMQHMPKEVVFKPDMSVSLLGETYTVKRGKLTTLVGKTLFVSGEEPFFHRRLCSYAQKMLLTYIQGAVKCLTKKLDVQAGRITLRNTSSRWGSCSTTHNLSFCWKLAFAPKEVIDYLIAHEVAHLVQMNHSPRFWSVVDALTDKRKEAERWLKVNGRRLQSIR